jgi:RHS repeat-associated protein
VRANLRYDPWGKQRWASQTTPTRYRFTAQRFDDKLGLYDYNARYYDANIGRFISADTYVPGQEHMALTVDFHEQIFLLQAGRKSSGPGSSIPQALNRYAYVMNSPTTLVDSTGHAPQEGSIALSSEEAQGLVDALTKLAEELTAGGSNLDLLAALAALLLEAGVAYLAQQGLLVGIFSAVGITVSAVAALILATLIVSLVTIGIGWQAEALKNAGGYLVDFFIPALQEAVTAAGPNGHISILSESRTLASDYVQILGFGENGAMVQAWNSSRTALQNDIGGVLIGWMKNYSDETGTRARFYYWYGGYDYYGNGQWSNRLGRVCKLEPHQNRGKLPHGKIVC